MPDLFETADQRRSPAHLAARALSLHVDSGAEITRAMLNAVMDSAFGGTDAQGRWTQRDSFEVLEHALVLSYRRNERSAFARNDLDTAIVQASRLPTQTVRSEQQLDWQQFSTPIDLSAVAVLLAQAEASDIVLEPSAGNGLLVAQLPDVAELQLNELDPARRNRLSDAFPQTAVTGHDGATIASTLAAAKRPTLILMNPPFSRSLGRGGDHLAAVRHLSAAIKHLRGGGRIVAIMPDWFAPSARLRDVFEATLAPVTVRNSIRLEKAYTKHGTSIAVRLYTALKTPAPLLEQTGVYLAYRPSRITFDAAGEHPTALVESVAMGSIPAPIPDYVPNLPERTVSERMLSASQLETVVYAGHAWDQWLPGIRVTTMNTAPYVSPGDVRRAGQKKRAEEEGQGGREAVPTTGPDEARQIEQEDPDAKSGGHDNRSEAEKAAEAMLIRGDVAAVLSVPQYALPAPANDTAAAAVDPEPRIPPSPSTGRASSLGVGSLGLVREDADIQRTKAAQAMTERAPGAEAKDRPEEQILRETREGAGVAPLHGEHHHAKDDAAPEIDDDMDQGI